LGEGITAEDMTTLCLVTRAIVVQVVFVEWMRDGLSWSTVTKSSRPNNRAFLCWSACAFLAGVVRVNGRRFTLV
jgi:hypothetical protein